MSRGHGGSGNLVFWAYKFSIQVEDMVYLVWLVYYLRSLRKCITSQALSGIIEDDVGIWWK